MVSVDQETHKSEESFTTITTRCILCEAWCAVFMGLTKQPRHPKGECHIYYTKGSQGLRWPHEAGSFHLCFHLRDPSVVCVGCQWLLLLRDPGFMSPGHCLLPLILEAGPCRIPLPCCVQFSKCLLGNPWMPLPCVTDLDQLRGWQGSLFDFRFCPSSPCVLFTSPVLC